MLGKKKTRSCHCLDGSLLVESLVILLTIVSVVAITGRTLIQFDVIIVPRNVEVLPGLIIHNGSQSTSLGGQPRQNVDISTTISVQAQNFTKPNSSGNTAHHTPSTGPTTVPFLPNNSETNSSNMNFSRNIRLYNSTLPPGQNQSQNDKSNGHFSKNYSYHTVKNLTDRFGHHTPDASESHTYKEADEDIEDLLQRVLEYINIGIAGLFLIEVFLKLVTLGKICLSSPSQILDGLIVLLCAAFQVVFRVISIPEIYYCCSYLIVLRLWRIWSVCYIKSKRMKELMERDIEHRISDHLKTRQRCIVLQNISLQQERQIKELDDKNRQLVDLFNNRESLQISEKQLMSLDSYNNNYNNNSIQQNTHQRRSSTSRSVDIDPRSLSYERRLSPMGDNDITSGGQSKPRWRRSSTNEYLEHRLSLYSDHYTLSCMPGQPNLCDHSEFECDAKSVSPTVDYLSDEFDETDARPDHGSAHSSSDSDAPTMAGDGVSKRKRWFKRQNSCPESMFTQSMKLTKVESILVEDHGLTAYNNNGFATDDGIEAFPLSAFSVRSRNFGSQSGIPTTDL